MTIWKAARLTAAGAWVAVVLSTSHARAAPVAYACEAGVTFEIEYSARRDKAELKVSGNRILMERADAPSGFRYEGSGYEIHGEDPVALFTFPGGRTVDCRIRPKQKRVTEEAAPQQPEISGPSFDCDGELSDTQKRVCAIAHLSELDGRMAKLYTELRNGMRRRARAKFDTEQKTWLAERDKCAARDACILDHYYGRIAYLEEFKELGAEPEPPPVPGAAETAPEVPEPVRPQPDDAPKAARPEAETATADASPEVNADKQAAPAAPALPRSAQSWGGIVRAGPGTRFRRIGSLKKGDVVTLLEDTGVRLNGYTWFKIEFGGRTGYQWGGILCAEDSALPGAYQVCE